MIWNEEREAGERQQEAEARSDVDEEERQKYFRRLWSLRQARVSARLKKGRNGAHQNVQKKHHQRRYQRQNGQKKQKYDTGPRSIVQNSLESRWDDKTREWVAEDVNFVNSNYESDVMNTIGHIYNDCVS